MTKQRSQASGTTARGAMRTTRTAGTTISDHLLNSLHRLPVSHMCSSDAGKAINLRSILGSAGGLGGLGRLGGGLVHWIRAELVDNVALDEALGVLFDPLLCLRIVRLAGQEDMVLSSGIDCRLGKLGLVYLSDNLHGVRGWDNVSILHWECRRMQLA